MKRAWNSLLVALCLVGTACAVIEGLDVGSPATSDTQHGADSGAPFDDAGTKCSVDVTGSCPSGFQCVNSQCVSSTNPDAGGLNGACASAADCTNPLLPVCQSQGGSSTSCVARNTPVDHRGNASLTGIFGGNAFQARDAIGQISNGTGGLQPGLLIGATNLPQACNDLGATLTNHMFKPSDQGVGILLQKFVSGVPQQPGLGDTGTYTIYTGAAPSGSGLFAQAQVISTDSTCAPTADANWHAASGTVQLQMLDSDLNLRAQVSLTLVTGETIGGLVNAVGCGTYTQRNRCVSTATVPEGTASSSGPLVGAASFNAQVAISSSAPGGGGGGSASTEIFISNTAGLCKTLVSDAQQASSITLQLQLAHVTSTTTPTLPAQAGVTYSVAQSFQTIGNDALITVNKLDGTCGHSPPPAGSDKATSGSVTINSAPDAGQAGAFSGTFDITMQNGDHITGTFSAPGCDDLAGGTLCE